ncbi:MAG: hypothetical protein J0H71_05665 [Rhizobiales bacterium]|nr:hypothetical protein [Hyphomicrobiales bacterium]
MSNAEVVPDDLLDAVYAEQPTAPDLAIRAEKKTKFAPWHHPVKQVVRSKQWADLTHRLLVDSRSPDQQKTLRYFTLPGADLLDVRVLAEALAPLGTKIEYFGFNAAPSSSMEGGAMAGVPDASFSAESALRQAGQITNDALVLTDRLEDIAIPGSQAANQLSQRQHFDVINIDGCDHLGYVPNGRQSSTFAALEKLLGHQLLFRKPWLLFITTRADAKLLGPHTVKMQGAILENIRDHGESFNPALADCIGANIATLQSDLNAAWSTQSDTFLKVYSVGLGKYLLHFFHGQHNLSADVELASVYTYPIQQTEPDMLSLAFRIIPHPLNVQPATAGTTSVRSPLEPEQGVKLAARAKRMWNIGIAVNEIDDLRSSAIDGTKKLLDAANYDLSAWQDWLAKHTTRAMQVEI